jgi:hypothetical protein
MEAAKTHLTTARNTLSELTQLPAAGQLQGETRNQVAQLINSFNELITTQSDWKASYAKVDSNLDALLATPAASIADDANRPTGTAGAVGTSGTKSASLDPTIRAKLVKLRAELDEFEKAAGAADTAATPSPSAAPATPSPAPATPTAPPAAATTSSTTTTTTTTANTAPTTPAAKEPPSGDTVTISAKDAIDHIDAIEVILGANADAQAAAQSAAGGAVTTSPTPSGSTRTTVTSSDMKLTAEQLSQLKTHLAELRRLIEKQ